MDLVTGFETVMKKYDVMNGQEFVDMAKEGLTYREQTHSCIFKSPERWAQYRPGRM